LRHGDMFYHLVSLTIPKSEKQKLSYFIHSIYCIFLKYLFFSNTSFNKFLSWNLNKQPKMKIVYITGIPQGPTSARRCIVTSTLQTNTTHNVCCCK